MAQWKAHAGRTVVVAFDRLGRVVASGGDGKDAGIRLMPLTPEGAAAQSAPRAIDPQVGQGGVWALAFSPTQDRLVASDGEGGLWSCDVETADTCTRRGDGPAPAGGDTVTAVSFSADGDCIAVGSWSGKVLLWDREFRSADVLGSEEAPVLSLAFTRRGGLSQLAVGRASRLRFLPVELPACRGDPAARERGTAGSPVVGDEVTGLAFDDERNLLAATTAVGYLALVDIERGTERTRTAPVPVSEQPADGEKHGWRGALASDEADVSRFVVGRETEDRLFVVRVGRDAKARVEHDLPAGQDGIERVTASVASGRVATLGKNGSIRFWTLRSGRLEAPLNLPALKNAWELANEAARQAGAAEPFPATLQANRAPARILLSPSGEQLACLFAKERRGTLIVELADLRASRWLPTGALAGREMAFSADGRLFAVGGEVPPEQRGANAGRDRILVWDARGRHFEARTTASPMQVARLADAVYELALATTRDGRPVVIAGGANGLIQVWDVDSGAPLRTLRVGSRQATQMVFLPSKNLLAAADPFGRVTLWDTGDWWPHELASRFDPTARPLFIAFALRGGLLVTGDDALSGWDIDTGSLHGKACDILGARSGAPVPSARVARACGVVPARR